MSSFRITGRRPLNGRLQISGRKNAALKLIASTILSQDEVILHHIPNIGDVDTMLAILKKMGASVSRTNGDVRINCASLSTSIIPPDMAKKLRASLVLVGPLLARFGEVTFPHPGGCTIGKRSIDPHLSAFASMAASVSYENGSYHLKAEKLVGTTLYLKERSVTGTENILMAAIRAEGTTTLYHAAEERHISNLANLLRQYGFQITGDGTSTIVIHGKPHHLGGQAEIDTIPDEIEVGTFVVAAAITGGTVSLERVGKRIDLLPILAIMDDFNVQYTYDEANEVLNILPSPELKATNFKTGPWPGFPTDLQSPFTILATQATGTSLIHDWMFEDRLYFVRTLHSMGASIVICDPHRILVTGPTPLTHSSLVTPDLRAGAAFVLAALAGEGATIVEHSEMIDRGYANLDERLRSLGADIVRID